ncbi:MAG TPA: hypothetical protein VGT08_20630 [Terracidiphilus sp.]|nr:hypothetical protein [Terracidiphilus sp.]
MQPHLSNLQFFVGIAALAIVAILALAAAFDLRKRRTPPFLNYFSADYDQSQFDRDISRERSFSGMDEWRAYNRARMHAYEAHGTAAHNSHWD